MYYSSDELAQQINTEMEEREEQYMMQYQYYQFKNAYLTVLSDIDMLSTSEKIELMDALLSSFKPGELL